MKNTNTVMILIGILMSVVLIIENMIVPLQAYVFIWVMQTWTLALISIGTGILLGYGLRGKMNEGNSGNDEDDNYGF